MMLPEAKFRQYGLPMDKPKGIVIHNTNTPLSAQKCAEWMTNSKTSRGAHYFVDADEVIQMLPLDWSCFNTGKGMDFGNTQCISIEICTDPSERRYEQGERRAIDLIKRLMKEYCIDLTGIYFHRDFNSSVNCPAQILKKYGTKQNFLNLLKGE